MSCADVFSVKRRRSTRGGERGNLHFVFLFSWSSLSHSPLIFLHCVCVGVCLCNVSLLFMLSLFIMVSV